MANETQAQAAVKSTATPFVDDANFKKSVPATHSKTEADYKKSINNLKFAAVLDERLGSGEKQHGELKQARAQFLQARATLVSEHCVYAEAKGLAERAADGFIADGKRELAGLIAQGKTSEAKLVALLPADAHAKPVKPSHPTATSSIRVEVVQPKATGLGFAKDHPRLVQAVKEQMGPQANDYAVQVATVEALACMNRNAFGKTADLFKADAEVMIPSTQEMKIAVALMQPANGKLNYSTQRPLAEICPGDTPKLGSVTLAQRN